MSVTLDQILLLSGRLDDAPGFDTPRERFRRFLLEHAKDLSTVRTLLDACQHSPDEQHHRALQDLVLLLGKFLGFDVTFGTYWPTADSVKYHGHWRSKSRLDVVLEVRTDQTAGTDLDALSRAIAGVASTARAPKTRPAGLCVVTPLFVNRHKLDEALGAARPPYPMVVLALGVLVSLAEMMNAGRVTHDEVVRVIESNLPVDFVVDILERFAAGRVANPAPAPETAAVAPEGMPADVDAACWIATVAADQATAPEQLLELVVGKRHIFGVSEHATLGAVARTGDRICFYIPGKGVVGRGRVRSMATTGSGIRDADRFRQLLHLEDIELHMHTPAPLDAETQLRLHTLGAGGGRQSQMLVRISPESFAAMTTASSVPRRETIERRVSGRASR